MDSYITGVDHIGVAVENIEEALGYYGLLGFELTSGPAADTERDVIVCFIHTFSEI